MTRTVVCMYLYTRCHYGSVCVCTKPPMTGASIGNVHISLNGQQGVNDSKMTCHVIISRLGYLLGVVHFSRAYNNKR